MRTLLPPANLKAEHLPLPCLSPPRLISRSPFCICCVLYIKLHVLSVLSYITVHPCRPYILTLLLLSVVCPTLTNVLFAGNAAQERYRLHKRKPVFSHEGLVLSLVDLLSKSASDGVHPSGELTR